jgi:energy-coupling factor transporter ATP-binding protein EcfA2
MTRPHDPKTLICFGKTGSGKSTFVRAMGGDVPEDELMDIDGEAVTEEAEFYPIHNKKDFPSFTLSCSHDLGRSRFQARRGV